MLLKVRVHGLLDGTALELALKKFKSGLIAIKIT